MVADLVKEAFELDGRLLQSLKLLLFQPGALAREFSANRRASYVSPVRLYLFSSLMFFAVLSLTVEFEGIPATAEIENASDVEAAEISQFRDYLEPSRQADLDTVLARDGTWAKAIVSGWIASLDEEVTRLAR